MRHKTVPLKSVHWTEPLHLRWRYLETECFIRPRESRGRWGLGELEPVIVVSRLIITHQRAYSDWGELEDDSLTIN